MINHTYTFYSFSTNILNYILYLNEKALRILLLFLQTSGLDKLHYCFQMNTLIEMN